MTTGIHNGTFDSLQLNAGAFIANFDHSELSTVKAVKEKIAALIQNNDGSLLGLTQGGGTFQCTPTMRNIEGDGIRSPFVGGTVNDGWTVKLTGTMKEIVPGNFRKALATADADPQGEKTVITVRTAIKKEDYIPKMTWIGDTSRGLVMIELENALNTVGATLTFTDKGEGTIPFEFQAHHTNAVNQDKAPCSVIFLNESTTAAAANTTDQTQPAANGDEPTA